MILILKTLADTDPRFEVKIAPTLPEPCVVFNCLHDLAVIGLVNLIPDKPPCPTHTSFGAYLSPYMCSILVIITDQPRRHEHLGACML